MRYKAFNLFNVFDNIVTFVTKQPSNGYDGYFSNQPLVEVSKSVDGLSFFHPFNT